MTNNSCKSFKFFVIILLAVVVAGMVLLGIFGLNKSVESGVNYQVIVGVDQDIDNVALKVKNETEKYFKEIGIKPYSTQIVNDGASFNYTFLIVDGFVEADLLSKITAVAGDKVVASCSLKQVKGELGIQALSIFYSLLIASALIIIYLLIMEKVANTFTTIINAIISTIIFISLLAITRIPITSLVSVFAILSFVVGMIISSVMCNRFKELLLVAGNEKTSLSEIAYKGLKDSAFRIIIYALLIALMAIVFAVMFTPNLIYVAVYAIISCISAVVANIFGSLVIWPALKNIKRRV